MRNRSAFARLLAPLAAIALAPACASEDATDVCQAAADHMRTCFPNDAVASAESCDPATAESVLAMDCNQLEAGLESAKSDGYYDVWAAQWCGWWGVMCSGTSTGSTSKPGSSSGSTSSGTTTQAGRGTLEISASSEYGGPLSSAVQAVRCAAIRVVDSKGSVVHEGYTTPGGRTTVPNLAAGKYTVELLSRAGDVAGKRDVSVKKNKSAWAYLTIAEEDATAVQQCITVRGDVTLLECGAEGTPNDREWAVRAVPTEESDLTRDAFWTTFNNTLSPSEPARIYNGSFALIYLPIGRYELEFIRLDLPSGNNLDMSKEVESSWNDPEVAGTLSISVADSDLVLDEQGYSLLDVELGLIEVENPRPACAE
jgi:hypothetical protein